MEIFVFLMLVYAIMCIVIFCLLCCQSGNQSAVVNSDRAITYPTSQPVNSSPQVRRIPLSEPATTRISPTSGRSSSAFNSTSQQRGMPMPNTDIGWSITGSQTRPYSPTNIECPYPSQLPSSLNRSNISESSNLIQPSAPQSTNNSSHLTDDEPPKYEVAIYKLI